MTRGEYTYSDNDLLEVLRKFYRETGKLPAKRDIPQFSTIYKRFGGWGNALYRAGLIPRPMSREELIDYRRELRCKEYIKILKEVYKKHREDPNWKGVARRKGRLSQKEYIEYYYETSKTIPYITNVYEAFGTYIIDDIWRRVEEELIKEGYFGR